MPPPSLLSELLPLPPLPPPMDCLLYTGVLRKKITKQLGTIVNSAVQICGRKYFKILCRYNIYNKQEILIKIKSTVEDFSLIIPYPLQYLDIFTIARQLYRDRSWINCHLYTTIIVSTIKIKHNLYAFP